MRDFKLSPKEREIAADMIEAAMKKCKTFEIRGFYRDDRPNWKFTLHWFQETRKGLSLERSETTRETLEKLQEDMSIHLYGRDTDAIPPIIETPEIEGMI